MKFKETAGDFLERHGKPYSDAGHFNVYKKDFGATAPLPHNRRDFYKISLVTKGEGFFFLYR